MYMPYGWLIGQVAVYNVHAFWLVDWLDDSTCIAVG